MMHSENVRHECSRIYTFPSLFSSSSKKKESMTFNIGIIGPGRHSDLRLAPALALAPSAQLWSVTSRDYERGKKFADKHNARSPNPVYTSVEEMLSDPELHGIIIASPDKLHTQQTILAAQAGKHCLVEKPLATNVEDCEEILKAAKEANICLAVAYHLRWHQGHRLIHKKVQEGAIGKIHHVRAQWTWKAEDGSNWRASPEVGHWWSIGGVGTHCLDLIRWFMLPTCGEVISTKAVFSSGVWDRPHDEIAVIALKFESGATAEICSSVLFESPSRLEIYGDSGYFLCENTFESKLKGGGQITTHEGNLDFPIQNPFLGEIENFVESAKGKLTPEVTGEEGLRNVEILTAASLESGLTCYAE